MVLEPSQAGRLEKARFGAIVRDTFGVDLSAPGCNAEVKHFPFGVAATHGDRGWIVSSSADPAVLGGVLLWVSRSSARRFDLVLEHHSGMHARRLAALAPEIAVWRLDDARVQPASSALLPPPDPPPAGVEHLERVIVEAGATVCRESGIVRAEVRGLEVGRIVVGSDGPVLEAGVGRFDREAGVLLHAHRDPIDSLRAVVAQVAPHRTAGAAPHPIGRLARSRWLRSLAVDDPALAGLDRASPVDPIPARSSLLDDVPASLIGHDHGSRVLVICSVGADLGLVPEAADQVLGHEPDEVRIVLPGRDRLPVVVELSARISTPLSFVDIDTPWSPSL